MVDLKKEAEIREAKEKIRSQNLTKLNFSKSEIENNQIDLDMKFAKILRRKLHYDAVIGEQEIYILSLIYMLQKRNVNAKKVGKYSEEFAKVKEEAEHLKERQTKFVEYSNLIEKAGGEGSKNKIDFSKLEKVDENMPYLQYVKNDPFYFADKERLQYIIRWGKKDFKEIPEKLLLQDRKGELKKDNEKYYFEYKRSQLTSHANYLAEEYAKLEGKLKHLEEVTKEVKEKNEKLKLDIVLMIRMKRGMDEVTEVEFLDTFDRQEEELNPNEFQKNDDDEEGLNNEMEPVSEEDINAEEQEIEEVKEEGAKFEDELDYSFSKEETKNSMGIDCGNSILTDTSDIINTNHELNVSYNKKLDNEKLNMEHNQALKCLTLENTLIKVKKLDIELKSKYLKLTKITKKIQEIVTGKNQIDQNQIAKLYEDKKKNLEENTAKRINIYEKKLRDINLEIRKKKDENEAFVTKIEKLKEDVSNTKDILDLDKQIGEGEEHNEESAKAGENKSTEIAELSKLKSKVSSYYEEIEYLRAELDKLRARTFPSFLQKPDNVIYPDEK